MKRNGFNYVVIQEINKIQIHWIYQLLASKLSTFGSDESLPLSTSLSSPCPKCDEGANCEDMKVGGAEKVAANFLCGEFG